jgi:hypothetical protein|tara:strand:- start:83 stop:376 length:294 start_codon:yes stop_codon:yes gene_type:complete
MRQVYSINLLKQLHLARYVYFNEEYDELYAWYGGHEIKIFDYTGTLIGNSSIVNVENSTEYKIHDEVVERDVHTSIDSIVHALFNDQEDERNIVVDG